MLFCCASAGAEEGQCGADKASGGRMDADVAFTDAADCEVPISGGITLGEGGDEAGEEGNGG